MKIIPNMEKEIVNQVQEAQRAPYRINPRRNRPRHILIKLTKTKHKEKILMLGPAQQQTDLREWCHRRIRKKKTRNKVGIRGLMPIAGTSPDTNPCRPFIVNFYFLTRALEISILYNLRSGIKIYNAQSSMSNLQAFHDFV